MATRVTFQLIATAVSETADAVHAATNSPADPAFLTLFRELEEHQMAVQQVRRFDFEGVLGKGGGVFRFTFMFLCAQYRVGC